MSKEISAEYLANLCLIKLTDQEKEALDRNLSKTLEYIDLLDEVDTDQVAPGATVLESMHNVMREDVEEKSFDLELFFKNAPDHVSRMIKVPPVIQFDE